MAASLDIIVTTANIFSIHNIVLHLNKLYDLNLQISRMTQIDNWLWEGEQGFSASDTIASCLMNGKIAVVGLESPLFKDVGIYVEKMDDKNIYTFWIDTETYPELDADIWDKDLYLKIFGGIEQVIKEFDYRAEAIAMGIETSFVYQKNQTEMMKQSGNINGWSFDQPIAADDLSEFSHSRIGDRDIYIHTGGDNWQ